MSRLPENLPDTASSKETPARWPLGVLACLGAIMLVLLAAGLIRSLSFSPGEEVDGDGLEGITVSAKGAPYPPPDVDRFARRPEAVYVYVMVREIPSGGRLEARVERASVVSVLYWLLIGGGESVVLERLEARPGPGEDPDVVRFAVREKSGAAVPSGDYTVSVYLEPGREPVARKYFVVRG